MQQHVKLNAPLAVFRTRVVLSVKGRNYAPLAIFRKRVNVSVQGR